MDTKSFNKQMQEFAALMAVEAQSAGKARGVGTSARSSGEGLASIRPVVGKYRGEVERVGVRFKRYLIFVHKGAGGKGGKAGSRRTRPFLDAGVERYHQQIADLAARYMADEATRANDRGLMELQKGSTSIRITRS